MATFSAWRPFVRNSDADLTSTAVATRSSSARISRSPFWIRNSFHRHIADRAGYAGCRSLHRPDVDLAFSRVRSIGAVNGLGKLQSYDALALRPRASTRPLQPADDLAFSVRVRRRWLGRLGRRDRRSRGLWHVLAGVPVRQLGPYAALILLVISIIVAITVLQERLDFPEADVGRLWIAFAVIALEIIIVSPLLRLGPWAGLFTLVIVIVELFLAGADLPIFSTLDKDVLASNSAAFSVIQNAEPARFLSLPETDRGENDDIPPSFAAINEEDARRYADTIKSDLNLAYP